MIRREVIFTSVPNQRPAGRLGQEDDEVSRKRELTEVATIRQGEGNT